MPAISAQKLQDRSDAILGAAQRVFVERGYQAASIAEIARAAHISDGLIYRYYDNKRALLDAVLAAFFERILAKLEPAIAAETGFAPKLRALIKAHLEIMFADPALCRLFISEVRGVTEFSDSEARRMSQRYSNVFLSVIRGGDTSGELRKGIDAPMLRDLVFGGVEHYAWRAMRSRKLSVESAAEKLADLVLGGVAKGR